MDSAISKVIEEIVLEDAEEAEERHDPAWSLEYHSFIKDRADFEAFPWDVLAELNYAKFENVKPYLPAGMKVIAVSDKYLKSGFKATPTPPAQAQRSSTLK